MATYDDYFKSLKHIVDSEIGKHFVPLKNNKDSLLAELEKLSQEWAELSAKLSKLRDESDELAEQKETNEFNLRQQKENIWYIFSVVLGGLGGGLISYYLASLFSADSFRHWYSYTVPFAIIGGILSLIIGYILREKGTGELFGAKGLQEFGCGMSIMTATIVGLLGAFFSHFVFFTVFGVISGAVIGFSLCLFIIES